LDHSITAHFRAWIATSAETWLRQRLAQGQHDGGVAVAVLAVACDTVGWLLREVSLHHRAAALLQETTGKEKNQPRKRQNHMELLEKPGFPTESYLYDYLCANAGFSLLMSMYWREPHLCLVCKTSPTFRHAT
jgi:hypothetical protein